MLARFFSLFVIGSLALLLAMPAVAQKGGSTTLRFIPQADLSSLDPYWSGVYITRNFGYMIYDTLFAMDSQFRPRPQMVETWKISDDELSYTFTLREGLKFHDGQPVRPTDVVASLKRWGSAQRRLWPATPRSCSGDRADCSPGVPHRAKEAFSRSGGVSGIANAGPVHHAGTTCQNRRLYTGQGGDRLGTL
jgi:hypothetical protein